MNSETRSALDIPKEFCHEEKCHKLVAAYLPFVNAIVVADDAPEEDLYAWVYHELVHAFQYNCRLPLDAALIMQSEFVNKSDMIDMLKYFYESQANYYTLKITRDQEWIDYGSSGLALIPGSVGKSILAVLSFGQTLRLGNSFTNDYLPIIDNLGWRQGHLHMSRGEQLSFHELIVLRNMGWSFNPSANFDLDFHTNYSRAIEQAYFGKIPHLLAKDGGDQKLFKKMNDHYYGWVLGNDLNTAECTAVLSKVEQAAPLVGWAKLSDKDLSSCSVYSKFTAHRDEFIEMYLNSNNRFFDKGGEGGPGPGLKLSPHFYQPQLIVKPPVD